ncbi:MAG: hypothetical protein ACYDCH_00905 [Gaiellaceae bacterium]
MLALAGARGADELDRRLHDERLDGRAQRHHRVESDVLPDGAFVVHDDAPWLVLGDELRQWTPSGYAARTRPPRGELDAITPPTLLAVLRAGWEPLVPLIHPSAGR